MAKLKKNHQRGPRRKRLKREARLQSARLWIPTYRGKNIVRGYANWYGVDWLCAIRELRMLEIPISTEYEQRVRQSMEDRAKHKARRRAEKEREQVNGGLVYGQDDDDYFAYIAGHTPAGFAFGVTWDEYEKLDPE